MKIKTWARMSHRLLTFRHSVMVFWCYKCSVFNSGCSLILFVVIVVVSFVEAKKKGRRKTSKNQSIPEDLGKVTWIWVVTGLEFDDSWKFYSFSNNSDQYGLNAADVGNLLRLSKLVDRFIWRIYITVHRRNGQVTAEITVVGTGQYVHVVVMIIMQKLVWTRSLLFTMISTLTFYVSKCYVVVDSLFVCLQ